MSETDLVFFSKKLDRVLKGTHPYLKIGGDVCGRCGMPERCSAHPASREEEIDRLTDFWRNK